MNWKRGLMRIYFVLWAMLVSAAGIAAVRAVKLEREELERFLLSCNCIQLSVGEWVNDDTRSLLTGNCLVERPGPHGDRVIFLPGGHLKVFPHSLKIFPHSMSDREVMLAIEQEARAHGARAVGGIVGLWFATVGLPAVLLALLRWLAAGFGPRTASAASDGGGSDA